MAVAAVGNVTEVTEFALNSSNKLLFVPSGKQWHLLSIFVKYVSTSGAGNRQVDVIIYDTSGNPTARYAAGAVQVASRTQYFHFAPSHPQETGYLPNASGGTMLRQISDSLWLTAGMAVRVWDSAAIAATTDDMSVTLLVDERSA